MKKGSALILVIIIFSIFSILGVLFARIVYNTNTTVKVVLQRTRAFYLAEAGLEKGKVSLAHNPNWFTDLPCYPDATTTWLISQAVGEKTLLGEGSFKVIREKGKNILYSIGQKGKGVAVLALKFSNPPFKSLEWKEI